MVIKSADLNVRPCSAEGFLHGNPKQVKYANLAALMPQNQEPQFEMNFHENSSDDVMRPLHNIDIADTYFTKSIFQRVKDFGAKTYSLAKEYKFIVITGASLLGVTLVNPTLGGVLIITAIFLRSVVYLINFSFDVMFTRRVWDAPNNAAQMENVLLDRENVPDLISDNTAESVSISNEVTFGDEKNSVSSPEEEMVPDLDAENSVNEEVIVDFIFRHSLENTQDCFDEKKKALIWFSLENRQITSRWQKYIENNDRLLVFGDQTLIDQTLINVYKESLNHIISPGQLMKVEKNSVDQIVYNTITEELKIFFEKLYLELKTNNILPDTITCLKKEFRLNDDQIEFLKNIDISNEEIIGVAIIGCYLIENIRVHYSID